MNEPGIYLQIVETRLFYKYLKLYLNIWCRIP